MRSVLITGCSDGGMGAALALEFQRHGYHVYATARNVEKMASLKDVAGIELLQLDITSPSSLSTCVSNVKQLDMLVNNAGALYAMPMSDVDLEEGKRFFDANVWGHIAATHAFLPLLRKSENGVIVNHTSVGADIVIPFQGVYNASKAALQSFYNTLRLELECVGVRVVNLKTAGVKTNVVKTSAERKARLPKGSVYEAARDMAEELLSGTWTDGQGISAAQWAKEVCRELVKKNPPNEIWKGEGAWAVWFAGLFLPVRMVEGMLKKTSGFDKIEKVCREERREDVKS